MRKEIRIKIFSLDFVLGDKTGTPKVALRELERLWWAGS